MTAARLRGIHVALAGDDSHALAQLTEFLRDDGALVTIHDSAQSLARLMRLLVVNVLVVDLCVLPSEAFTLIRNVRALTPDDGGRVPIVALYAGPDGAVPRLIAADVNSIVRKPVDMTELARIINAVLAAAPHRT